MCDVITQMNMEDIEIKNGTVKSDRTLLSIIDALHKKGELSVADLTSEVDVTKSAIHKHLKTLENLNYVMNNGGSYELGFKFYTYGAEVKNRSRLCTLLDKKTREVVERTNETGTAAIEEYGMATLIAISNDNLEKTSSLGTRFHLNVSSSGKAILAELPDSKISAIIDRYGLPQRTKETITTKETLFEEVDHIRERNYATNIEELRKGMNAVSVAVQNPETDKIGALTVSGPANRITKKAIEEEYSNFLFEFVNEIELELNYG